VQGGDQVARGQQIGTIGRTGNYGGVPHLHFQLGINGHLDPMKYIVGCYDPAVEYRPTDKLVLTYPLRCRNR
jgi:hypothetical protein